MVVCHLPFGPTAYFGLYNTVSLQHSAPLISTICQIFFEPPRCQIFVEPPRCDARGFDCLFIHNSCKDSRREPFVPAQIDLRSQDILCEKQVQVLRHDIGEKKAVGTISEAYPHLVLHNFTSSLGQRVSNILKYLFPSPKVSFLLTVSILRSQKCNERMMQAWSYSLWLTRMRYVYLPIEMSKDWIVQMRKRRWSKSSSGLAETQM